MLLSSLLIISFAFFAEAIFGFGGGLISIPLLSLFMPIKNSVTLVLIFQLLIGLLIFKTYKHTAWKIALPLTLGLIFGTVGGTYLLSSVNDDFLRKFLVVSILVFLIKTTFLSNFNFGRFKGKLAGIFAGILGGVFQGVIGTGGPVFTMYLAVVTPEKLIFRATLIYLFFATSLIRITTSFTTGLLTPDIMKIALPIIPAFLVAIYAGNHIHKKIDQKYYDYAVKIILLFSSISLLLK